MENGEKTKMQFDKNTSAHKFKIGDKVLISNNFYIGKNPKLAPKLKDPLKLWTLMTLMTLMPR